MAVPDTDDFTLQDVVTEINPTTDDLVDCFADADVNQFDGDYEGDKTQLLNFRNYGAVCQATTGWADQAGVIGSFSNMTNNRLSALGGPLPSPNPFNLTNTSLFFATTSTNTYSYEVFAATVNMDGSENAAVSVLTVNNVTGNQSGNIPYLQTFPISFYTVKITANPPITFTSLTWRVSAINPAFDFTAVANNVTTTCT